ncbi:MAG: hypothetical protein ACYC5Q_14965 [Thermoleophilia bacterium]
MGIVRDSSQLLFAGVNYVLAPPPPLDSREVLGFQGRLAEGKLEFQQAQRDAMKVLLTRTQGSPLQVQVLLPGPPVGQLLILAEQPLHTLDLVIKEMRAVVKAFEENWGIPQQVFSKDVTLRHLYSITGEHAFQYLWEERLGQTDADLSGLGSPVQGGGLRLVMPPGTERKCLIELKIESFLRDSEKLFIETVFTWPEPEDPGTRMHPESVVEKVRLYALGSALNFADTQTGE